MRLLIAGSRPFARHRSLEERPAKLQVLQAAWNEMVADCEDYISKLPKTTLVIVGGAQGIDRIAEAACDRNGVHCAVIRAPSERVKTVGKSAFLRRDDVMISHADKVAVWRFNGSIGSTYVLEHSGEKLVYSKDVNV